MALPSQSSSAAPEASLERVVRIGLLMDLYGRLLTERQQSFMRLHFEDDFSFGEIARQFNVSRQAVHDAVKNAEASLEDYESKLQLLGRGMGKLPAAGSSAEGDDSPEANPSGTGSAGAVGDASLLEQAAERLRGVETHLQRSGGIIYNVEGLRTDIAAVRDLLDRALGAAGREESED